MNREVVRNCTRRFDEFWLSFRKYGAGEGNRTPDLRFTKPLLYRLSYAGRITKSTIASLVVAVVNAAGKHRPRREISATRDARSLKGSVDSQAGENLSFHIPRSWFPTTSNVSLPEYRT
jgi:hypothetical protein